MRKRYLIIPLVVALTVGVSSWLLSAAEDKKKEELYKEVSLFSDTLAIIETDYVDEAKPKDLIYGALKGMLGSLDPHSQFMDPETYNDLKVETEGKFGGLGIEITLKDGLITIITPIEDTPAWKAGLKAGDRIVKINDEITRNMTLIDAVKKMRGKLGEAVNITVLREGEQKILEFKIVRDIIKIKDLKEARILEDGIGYIRLVEFRENTYQELNQALDNLAKAGMVSLVLDLRNNPGGLLDVAANVGGKFIPSGEPVVYTKGRKSRQNLELRSKDTRPLLNIPIAVLINEGSASGAEIVAGCLKDHKRAIIVGVRSFGKGSVQTVIPLSDGSALRLTTSKYYTPLGLEIHGKGVVPDIEVKEGRIETVEPKRLDSLKGEEVFETLDRAAKKPQEAKSFDYKTDNQLMRAVDILKAYKVYKAIGNK